MAADDRGTGALDSDVGGLLIITMGFTNDGSEVSILGGAFCFGDSICVTVCGVWILFSDTGRTPFFAKSLTVKSVICCPKSCVRTWIFFICFIISSIAAFIASLVCVFASPESLHD